jgi:hypothetical protein
MAAYLYDAWPDSEQAAADFALDDLAEMVREAAGAAEREQASVVFLEAVRELLDWGRVRLEGRAGGDRAGDGQGRATVIGRVAAGPSSGGGEADRVVELSIALALQAVNRSLRQQGRPALQVGEKTLIGQLEAEGLLVDREGRPVAAGEPGVKSRQVRIERRRVRVIRLPLAALLGPDDSAEGELQAAD